MKDLYTDETINTSGGSTPSATLECLGYNNWLNVFVYNDLNPLSVTFSTKLESIITAEPNSVISRSFDNMDNNPLLTTAYEDENRIADSIIQSLVIQGDGANARWTWGVYEHRKVHYKPIPSTFTYVHMVSSSNPIIRGFDGGIINGWAVRPANWVFLQDFLVGLSSNSVDRLNARAMFIESVNFTAPSSLTLNGARINSVEQRLAQLGMKGM